MEQKENSFHYTYSAAQQQEIENIRKKYLPETEDKMEQLRRLHNSANQKAQCWALTFGVIGTLLLGTGMSLLMTELRDILGLELGLAVVIGMALGLAGMLLVIQAYPIYSRILKKERERIAPQILQLTDELLK